MTNNMININGDGIDMDSLFTRTDATKHYTLSLKAITSSMQIPETGRTHAVILVLRCSKTLTSPETKEALIFRNFELAWHYTSNINGLNCRYDIFL